MTTPVSEIDSRYSDPDSAVSEWTETVRIIEEAELFWISTVRADGRPHVTPVVAVWLDGALHFSTGAAEQKAVNLTANPHVSLTTGCNSWDSMASTSWSRATPEPGDQPRAAAAPRRGVVGQVGRPLALRGRR